MAKGRISSTVRHLGVEYYGNDPISDKFGETDKELTNMFVGDQGHYGYPNFPPLKDVGGALYMNGVRTSRFILPVGDIWKGNPNPLNQHYTGSLYVDIPHTGAWVGSFLPDSWGAAAYAKMKPTRPIMSLYNSLFELKDLPGMLGDIPLSLWQAVRSFRDGGAGHFVGYQFGWKQLVQDIQKLVNAQRNGQKKLAWLLRHNAKPVKTACELLNTDAIVEDTALTGYGYIQPVLVTGYYAVQPYGRRLTHNKERVWAHGQYRYWLPEGPRDIDWTNRMLESIYGENITPGNVFAAIPWSWLISWFSNVGAMINNLDAGVADRLTSDYNYVMRSKEWTISNTITGEFVDKMGQHIKVTGTSSSTAFVKSRSRGDPFGFATDASTLSGMQLAILGALGLSRLR